MDPIIIERTWSQGSPVEVEPLRGTAFTEESGAHQFRIAAVDQDRQPAALSGTVLGKMIRADNWTVDIDGEIDQETGEAVLTLVGDCYNVPGRFSLVVYLSDGTDTMAVYACVGSVYRGTSGQELDSGTTVPTLQQLEAAWQAAVTAAQEASDAAAALPDIATVAETKTYLGIT